MKKIALLFILTVVLCATLCAAPNDSIKIAFYNTENLMDTLRNRLTNDVDYTPDGAYRWNTQKYYAKITNIARVLDDLKADIVGLSEVENEEVARDLIRATQTSYNYIHRPTSDSRGIDLVLFYRPDLFLPTKIEQASGKGVKREFLVVTGLIDDREEAIFVVCHMPSLLNTSPIRVAAAESLRTLIEMLQKRSPNAKILVMGDFNNDPDSYIPRRIIGVSGRKTPSTAEDKHLIYSPFIDLHQLGYSSYVYRDRRQLYDYILVSYPLLTDQGLRLATHHGVFARDYMIYHEGIRRGYPIRGYNRAESQMGFSDHLPVYITLRY